MAPDRNKDLLNLFVDEGQELDGEAFTTRVMAQTNNRRIRIVATAASLAVILMAMVWVFSAPLQEFALIVSQGLATPLVELGDNRLAWIFAPVNNVAGLLVLIVKLVRVGWKKLGLASFAF